MSRYFFLLFLSLLFAWSGLKGRFRSERWNELVPEWTHQTLELVSQKNVFCQKKKLFKVSSSTTRIGSISWNKNWYFFYVRMKYNGYFLYPKVIFYSNLIKKSWSFDVLLGDRILKNLFSWSFWTRRKLCLIFWGE